MLIVIIFTHQRQKSFQFCNHDCAIFILVVKFAQFNVVMIVAGVIGLFDGLVDEFDNLIKLAEFLFGIVLLTVLDADRLHEVHAHGVHDVAEVVHVQFTFSMPVVDSTDPFDFISILYLKKVIYSTYFLLEITHLI